LGRRSQHLDQLLPASKGHEVEHHPALPYEQILDFMAELRAQEGLAAKAPEFTIQAVPLLLRHTNKISLPNTLCADRKDLQEIGRDPRRWVARRRAHRILRHRWPDQT
jgi:hypothetical protein